MTTISPNRRGLNQTSRLKFAFYTVVFLLLVAAALLWRGPLAGLLWRAGTPLLTARAGTLASVGALFSGFSSNKTLALENDALRAQIASTSVALMDRDMLYAENLQLKTLLNNPVSVHTTLAAVLMRPPGSPYDTLMLDVGSQNGVAVGDLVAAGGSIYIGTIEAVYPTASRATLFSAPGETYEALLINKRTNASVPISIAGQGGASLTGQVPAGTDVAVGDRIIFPGVASQLVAQVSAVDSTIEQSFKTVYMQLPVNPFSLQFVEVRRVAP